MHTMYWSVWRLRVSEKEIVSQTRIAWSPRFVK